MDVSVDLFLMYAVKGFVERHSVGVAVAKTLMRTYERQKNGEKVRVGTQPRPDLSLLRLRESWRR